MACRRELHYRHAVAASPRLDAVGVAVRESTRLAREPRRFRDGVRATQGGYFIELGMGLCEQVYFDPALVDIIDGAFYYWSELKQKTLKLLPKWIIGSSAEQAADKGPEEKTAKRDLEGAVAEGGETVEPILDAFGAYAEALGGSVFEDMLA